jgi:hypothetical protein
VADPVGRLRTYSAEHLRWLRNKHAHSDGYGRHRHLYLHDTMRELAGELAVSRGCKPTLLDYGCGKGQFMEEMRKLDIFAEIEGYDPGFADFEIIGERRYDIVTCIDVLDAAEKRYIDAIVTDVAQRNAGVALFDCLTKPLPKSGFEPHPPHYWHEFVRRRMDIVSLALHFPWMNGYERTVIVAKPKS